MRLCKLQQDAITQGVRKNFGRLTRLWLFGSRIDENALGGDIDLYVEPEIQDPTELIEAKPRFLMELHKIIGDRKVDLVIKRADGKIELPIHQIARETGVRLL
jgi:predicted nucleotidyltransferase